MPRRNRNAGTPRPDTDQLAAELDQLAADLRPGTSTVLIGYLARTVTPGSVFIVTGCKQPIPQFAAESR
jgi:hypothetical protein